MIWFREYQQATAMNDFIVVISSEDLDGGSTYNFSLRLTTVLGGWGEASVAVSKSTDGLPALKVRQEASPTTAPTSKLFHLIEMVYVVTSAGNVDERQNVVARTKTTS